MALSDKINQARQQGFSDDEIVDSISRTQPEYTDRIRLARTSGIDSTAIVNRMSQVYTADREQHPLKEQIRNAVNQGIFSHTETLRQKALHEQEVANRPLGIPTEELKRGLQRSSIGRYVMEQEPEQQRQLREQYGPEPTLLEATARGLGEYAGDIPAMAVGGALGAPVGAIGGGIIGGAPGAITGGYVGQGAGAFALPEALKQIRDKYEEAKAQKKDLSWDDYLSMAYEGTVNPSVAKHALLGGTVGAVSPAMAAVARSGWLAPLLKNPVAAQKVLNWATLAGEGGVLVADKAIEKGEMPTTNDIAEVGTQLLTLKLAHGIPKQLKKLYDITQPQLSKAIEEAPKQVQADLLSNDINSSKFNEAFGEVVSSARKKIEQVRVEGAKRAEEHRTTGKENIAKQALPPKEEKILTRKVESQAKRIERKTEREATALEKKLSARQKKAAETGYIVYKEGEVNPLSENPEKLIKVRYVHLKPEETGMTNTEIIRKSRGKTEPKTTLQKAKDLTKKVVTAPREAMRKIYTGLFDKANALRSISDVTGENNLRKSYDKAKRADVLVEYELLYGEVDPITNEKITENSLAEMAKKSLPENYGKEGRDIEDLKDYLVGAASIDRTNLGQKNPIATVAAEGIQREKSFFKPVAKELWDFQDRYLQRAVKEGLISPQGYNAMKEMYKAYIPLYRVQEDALIKPEKGKTLQPFAPIKKAKGSEAVIDDPITNVVKNLRSLNQARANNEFANELRTNLEKMGFKATHASAPKIKGAREAGNKRFEAALENSGGWFAADAWTDGNNTIYGYRNGKRWKIEGVPSEVVNVLRAPKPAGKFLRAIQGLARLFSKGATVWKPLTSTLIGVKDTMTTAAASRGPLGVFSYYSEFLPAVGSVLKKDALFQDFVKSGAYTHTFRGMNKVPFEETVTDIFTAAKDKSNPALAKRAIETLASPKKILNGIEKTLSAYSEGWSNAGRIAWLETEIKRPEYKGYSREQAYNAAVKVFNERLLQFDRVGGWEWVQQLSRVIPFFNTTLQDSATLGRLMKKGGPMFYTNAAISMTLPAMFSHMMVMDDERYKRLQDYEKQRNFIVKPYFGLLDDGKQDLWQFPKPWNLGYLFGTTAEMLYDYIVSKDGEKSAKEALQEWALGELQEINPFSVISGVRAIEPKKLEHVAAEEQYTPNTTAFAKFFAQNIGTHLKPLPLFGKLASPLYVDAAISYFGTPVAKELLHLADELMFYTGIKDDRRPEGRDFAAYFLKRFYTQGQSLSSSYLSKFYDYAEKADEAANTYRLFNKRGNQKEADEYVRKHGYYSTPKARKTISAIFQRADEIQQAPLSEISAKQKDKLLRELASEMDEVAKYYVQEMKNAGINK